MARRLKNLLLHWCTSAGISYSFSKFIHGNQQFPIPRTPEFAMDFAGGENATENKCKKLCPRDNIHPVGLPYYIDSRTPLLKALTGVLAKYSSTSLLSINANAVKNIGEMSSRKSIRHTMKRTFDHNENRFSTADTNRHYTEIQV